MASANFKKIKTKGEAKAIINHCDKDERKKHKHANKEINLDKTYLNMQYDMSFKQTIKALDDRLDYLDSLPKANKRKDRTVLVAIDIPAPKDLGYDYHTLKSWFSRVNDIVSECYGENNLLQSYVHFDEVHNYMDYRTKEYTTSRVHGHFFVIPEVDGRLCAKKVCCVSSMKILNNEIQKMSYDEFGVEFMDGSKRKSKLTVEEMKNKSAYLEFCDVTEEVLRMNAKEELDKEKAELEIKYKKNYDYEIEKAKAEYRKEYIRQTEEHNAKLNFTYKKKVQELEEEKEKIKSERENISVLYDKYLAELSAINALRNKILSEDHMRELNSINRKKPLMEELRRKLKEIDNNEKSERNYTYGK